MGSHTFGHISVITVLLNLADNKKVGKFGITVEKQGQDKFYDVETTSLNDQQMKLGDK